MALVVCKNCRRAFISAQDEELCSECTTRLNELYPVVRNFLRNHEEKLYTAHDVARILGIDVKDVEGLVTLGLIDSGATQKQAGPRRPPNSGEAKKGPKAKKESSMYVYHKKRT